MGSCRSKFIFMGCGSKRFLVKTDRSSTTATVATTVSANATAASTYRRLGRAAYR